MASIFTSVQLQGYRWLKSSLTNASNIRCDIIHEYLNKYISPSSTLPKAVVVVVVFVVDDDVGTLYVLT